MLVLGSSHVRRLSNSFEQVSLSGSFNIDGVKPFFRGIGGRLARDIMSEDDFVVELLKPDFCFLVCGGNDLSDPTVSALEVANNIFDVVEWLHKTHHVTFIAVSQLFWRFAKPDPSKGRPLSPEVYNAKVAEVNSILEVSLLAGYSMLWRNKGLFANPSDFLTADQVHLNFVGNQRLYRSIRGAILFALRRISGARERTHVAL